MSVVELETEVRSAFISAPPVNGPSTNDDTVQYSTVQYRHHSQYSAHRCSVYHQTALLQFNAGLAADAAHKGLTSGYQGPV
jgi:hypothetical protein